MGEEMLEISNLCKEYTAQDKNNHKTKIKAVDDVSFTLEHNRIYALVGESGSGKSTLAKLITQIETKSSGHVLLEGVDLSELKEKMIRKQRAQFQFVMQDACSCLNPKFTAFDCIAEPLNNYFHYGKKELVDKVTELMKMVELMPELSGRFPHQLSGGQQKRLCIARAIALFPKLIIFDEAVSGLDVTVKKKILDLLLTLQKKMEATYLFITHDMDVALYISSHIFIMKDGKIIEKISDAKDFTSFQHPYSKLLINSLPPTHPSMRRRNQNISKRGASNEKNINVDYGRCGIIHNGSRLHVGVTD